MKISRIFQHCVIVCLKGAINREFFRQDLAEKREKLISVLRTIPPSPRRALHTRKLNKLISNSFARSRNWIALVIPVAARIIVPS